MSLVRLLTAGKSLVGGVDTVSRYYFSGQRLLPKFNPKQNPFRATTRPESARAAAVSAVAEAATPLTAEASPAGGRASGDQEEQHDKPGGEAKSASWLDRWFTKASSWFQARRPNQAKPAIPRFTKPAVQGELSLDSVKVVRNDLRDSDLEVVPAELT